MPNKNGALGLHAAAAAGYNDVMLLARGTRVDIATRDNYTALTVAVQSGQAAVVETLLGFGADVHIEGGQIGEVNCYTNLLHICKFQTALHVAAGLPSGNIECAQMLLFSGAQPNVRRSDGMTPLHISARTGNKEMVRLLLAEGADPKLKSKIGETPLHLASKQCHLPVVLLLLEKIGKDSHEIREYDGQSSVHYASQIMPDQNHFIEEDTKIVSTLVDSGGDCEKQTLNTPMHMCARSGNEGVLLAMVNKIGPGSVQIVQNKKSKNGWSPLLEACARGHVGVSRILLQHHARIDVFDECGREKRRSSIAFSCTVWTCKISSNACSGRVIIIKKLYFKEHGASLEAITLNNQTALHFAAKFGQLIVAQTLLAFGANPNAKDDKGQTPLHLAAEVLLLQIFIFNIVRMIIRTCGFTCAHIAAMKGSLAVAMVIHAKTKILEATTLHMAASGGHSRIVKILLENGASPEDENANGMTPLSLAAWNGHVPILACFDKKYWRRCSKKVEIFVIVLILKHRRA
ncbi:unnamed protein product [Meloidogyne enterolobii]|uniref:Uncharacterized protein n=2 Tax=Meloidogyne enterolobii TaxID=390850 RepID=A0ACB0YW23_MELEN